MAVPVRGVAAFEQLKADQIPSLGLDSNSDALVWTWIWSLLPAVDYLRMTRDIPMQL